MMNDERGGESLPFDLAGEASASAPNQESSGRSPAPSPRPRPPGRRLFAAGRLRPPGAERVEKAAEVGRWVGRALAVASFAVGVWAALRLESRRP